MHYFINMRILLPSIAVSVVLSLFACTKPLPLPPLPEGEQSAMGILTPVPISLVRRGTHVLLQGEEPLYYVESPTVNLGPFENRTVRMRGTIVRNTDPYDAPILLVSEVSLVEGEEVRTLTLSPFHMTINVPSTWSMEDSDDTVTFRSGSGSDPVLTLAEELRRDLPAKSSFEIIPGQEIMAILVGARRSLLLLDTTTGWQKLFIDPGSHPDTLEKLPIITLLYSPTESTSAKEAKETMLRILNSVRFHFRNPPSSRSSAGSNSIGADRGSSASGTPNAQGTPCGGPAGILCPAGYFCEITDLQTSIGKCRMGVR
ncbi:MAG: hypothetical protein Q7R81_00035 [Candidatus Peregrinibacteria bacterium]|nr:hypothetical protein [Candidatus Peregrinibacteria bacterium]